MVDLETLRNELSALHRGIRQRVVDACEGDAVERLSQVAHDAEGDTIYAIGRPEVLRRLESQAVPEAPPGDAAGAVVD